MSEEKTTFDLPDEFLEQIVKDTEIDDYNLKEQVRTVVDKTQKYIEELYRQKRKMKQLDRYIKKVKGELFHYYKTEYELKLSSSTDIMIFVERDKKYQTAKRHYDDLEAIVDFLDRTVKNMNNKGWALRNMIDIEKLNV